MSFPLPFAIRLTRRVLARSDRFCALIHDVTQASRADAALAFHAFAFKGDEHAFARAILDRRTQLWLFRTNQRASSGDFVALDMSSPRPEQRRAFVLELKRGMRLRVDAGAVGVQLRNACLALRSLARVGLLAEDAPWCTLAGDASEIAVYLGQAHAAGSAATRASTSARTRRGISARAP